MKITNKRDVTGSLAILGIGVVAILGLVLLGPPAMIFVLAAALSFYIQLADQYRRDLEQVVGMIKEFNKSGKETEGKQDGQVP